MLSVPPDGDYVHGRAVSPRARTRALIEYMTVSIENISILGDFYFQQALLASVDNCFIHYGI